VSLCRVILAKLSLPKYIPQNASVWVFKDRLKWSHCSFKLHLTPQKNQPSGNAFQAGLGGAFLLSTQPGETGAGGLSQIQGHLGLHLEVRTSQSYKSRPYLKERFSSKLKNVSYWRALFKTSSTLGVRIIRKRIKALEWVASRFSFDTYSLEDFGVTMMILVW
jgi:hypothetical protein